ncbi:hypothetical protein [Streptosporangium sp. NPDC020145]|uniref:hypothetical protein n=1 Tax=Streptosporangium sp. NPDC020145 TaxID=3154694 RepID=UPI00341C3816
MSAGNLHPVVNTVGWPGLRPLQEAAVEALLAGRTWRVTYIDWSRRRCYVEAADGHGRARWGGTGYGGLSWALTRAMREVLLGADPPVRLSRRAVERLAVLREDAVDTVHPGGTVVTRDPLMDDVRWWTWADFRANATLAATLEGVRCPVSVSTRRPFGCGATSPRAVEGGNRRRRKLALPSRGG